MQSLIYRKNDKILQKSIGKMTRHLRISTKNSIFAQIFA